MCVCVYIYSLLDQNTQWSVRKAATLHERVSIHALLSTMTLCLLYNVNWCHVKRLFTRRWTNAFERTHYYRFVTFSIACTHSAIECNSNISSMQSLNCESIEREAEWMNLLVRAARRYFVCTVYSEEVTHCTFSCTTEMMIMNSTEVVCLLFSSWQTCTAHCRATPLYR